jgi:hypothetical protein
MRRTPRILFGVAALYALALASCSVWLAPSLVADRVAGKVKLGMSGKQVSVALGISEPTDFPEATYCAPASNERFKRMSLYDAGSVELIPLLTVWVTTTRLCFDNNDRLAAFHTDRWIDAP